MSEARVENDGRATLHCLQLKAVITILLQHVIILMLSMESNWPTIDLEQRSLQCAGPQGACGAH